LAYVASELAGITNKTSVYEPTAGNGMLLIGANPENVVANELNKDRFEMLKQILPGAELSTKMLLISSLIWWRLSLQSSIWSYWRRTASWRQKDS